MKKTYLVLVVIILAFVAAAISLILGEAPADVQVKPRGY